jgi:hypothetical protein
MAPWLDFDEADASHAVLCSCSCAFLPLRCKVEAMDAGANVGSAERNASPTEHCIMLFSSLR